MKSELEYNTLYSELDKSVPTKVMQYYNANWHDIRDEWVDGLKNTTAHFMNRINNRLESINQKVKSVMTHHSGITTFSIYLMKCLSSMSTERDHRAANTVWTVPFNTVAQNSPPAPYIECLTPYAYRFVKTQIKHCKSTKLVEFVDEQIVEFADELSARIQTVHVVIMTTSSRCLCAFNVSVMLPCGHMFAVRMYKALPLYDESLFAKRWTKNYLQISHHVLQDTQTDSNRNTSGLPHSAVISKYKTAKVKSQ